MANYDIRPLQLRILKNLLAVDKVCKEHNLRYYIMAGTMLGAVRHKGFIPWDDDLDIGMPRADYDLLMANAKEWLPKPYEAVCAENDKEYPLPFAKVQDADTTLIERMHLKYLGGVYIDIFPLDGVPESRMAQRMHFAKYEFYKRVLYLIHRDPYKHGKGPSSWIPLLCRKLFTLTGAQESIRKVMKKYDFDQSAFCALKIRLSAFGNLNICKRCSRIVSRIPVPTRSTSSGGPHIKLSISFNTVKKSI